MAEGGHRRRVADSALPEVGGDRVTRDEVGDHERHQGDPDQQHHAGAEPPEQETAQVVAARPGTSPGTARLRR